MQRTVRSLPYTTHYPIFETTFEPPSNGLCNRLAPHHAVVPTHACYGLRSHQSAIGESVV